MVINSIQIAYFLSSINLADRLTLAKNINDKTNNMFDGEPLILPIPDQAPAEIPRIVLKTKLEDLTMNISPSRIDLIFNNKEKKELDYIQITQKFLDLIKNITELLIGNYSASVVRLGLVSVVGFESNDPINCIYKQFSKKFILEIKEKDEVQIHLFKEEKISNFDINNWIRIIAQNRDPQRDKFNVLNDLNIKNNLKEKITDKRIMLFFEEMFKYMKNNFTKYAKKLSTR